MVRVPMRRLEELRHMTCEDHGFEWPTENEVALLAAELIALRELLVSLVNAHDRLAPARYADLVERVSGAVSCYEDDDDGC